MKVSHQIINKVTLEEINPRRYELITKRHETVLSEAEFYELRILQTLAHLLTERQIGCLEEAMK